MVNQQRRHHRFCQPTNLCVGMAAPNGVHQRRSKDDVADGAQPDNQYAERSIPTGVVLSLMGLHEPDPTAVAASDRDLER